MTAFPYYNDDDDDDDPAHARHTDPETSHEAAKTVKKRKSQEAVYRVLARWGPMCHTELIERYRISGEMWQTDQGIRSRCSELEKDQGRVTWNGKYTILETGNRSKIWVALK